MAKKKDRWPELCSLVSISDGLPVRDAGPWTEDKLYFWNRYIDITTSSMVDNPKWPAGLAYVDLFAGPGICQNRETGKRFPGSALIAANALKPFSTLLACELDQTNADALERRLEKSPVRGRYKVLQGDCNEQADRIIAEIPARALTLAFIDPEALHVWFDTVRKLSSCGRVDLLILLADRMDIVRNVDVYFKQNNSNLDRMMGPNSTWRQRWATLGNPTAQNICQLFADEYKSQLANQLGYKVFGEYPIPRDNPLYRLIYASKHRLGLKFWNEITQRDRHGQREMFGGG